MEARGWHQRHQLLRCAPTGGVALTGGAAPTGGSASGGRRPKPVGPSLASAPQREARGPSRAVSARFWGQWGREPHGGIPSSGGRAGAPDPLGGGGGRATGGDTSSGGASVGGVGVGGIGPGVNGGAAATGGDQGEGAGPSWCRHQARRWSRSPSTPATRRGLGDEPRLAGLPDRRLVERPARRVSGAHRRSGERTRR